VVQNQFAAARPDSDRAAREGNLGVRQIQRSARATENVNAEDAQYDSIREDALRRPGACADDGSRASYGLYSLNQYRLIPLLTAMFRPRQRSGR
jgi:hypothetical protein